MADIVRAIILAAVAFPSMRRRLFPGGIDRGNRIVAVVAARAAAADPFGRQPAAFDGTMLLDRFLAVFRTGGQIAALAAQPR